MGAERDGAGGEDGGYVARAPRGGLARPPSWRVDERRKALSCSSFRLRELTAEVVQFCRIFKRGGDAATARRTRQEYECYSSSSQPNASRRRHPRLEHARRLELSLLGVGKCHLGIRLRALLFASRGASRAATFACREPQDEVRCRQSGRKEWARSATAPAAKTGVTSLAPRGAASLDHHRGESTSGVRRCLVQVFDYES